MSEQPIYLRDNLKQVMANALNDLGRERPQPAGPCLAKRALAYAGNLVLMATHRDEPPTLQPANIQHIQTDYEDLIA